jgi:hypothetical protein
VSLARLAAPQFGQYKVEAMLDGGPVDPIVDGVPDPDDVALTDVEEDFLLRLSNTTPRTKSITTTMIANPVDAEEPEPPVELELVEAIDEDE